MKRKISVLIILMMFSGMFSVPYAKKCIKCQDEYSKYKAGCTLLGCAWRDFKVPMKEENGKIYIFYRCQYGHTFWAEY